MAFAELSITSNFSFLSGASHPEEFARRAAELGLPAIAVADLNSVAGVVRAHQALREIARGAEARLRDTAPPTTQNAATPSPAALRISGIGDDGAPIRSLPRLLPAARIALECGTTFTALPTDRAAWGRLMRLLTLGKRRAQKGACVLHAADLIAHADGMILLLHPGDPLAGADPGSAATHWAAALPGQVHLLAAPRYDGRDRLRIAALARAADAAGTPLVASAAPIMHHGSRRRIADVLSCIRLSTTIDTLGRAAQPNAERRLRSEAEIRSLFAGHEHAVDRAGTIADACGFSLDHLRYEYPDEVAEGLPPQTRLAQLTEQGLAARYPDGVPPRVRAMVNKELALIDKLNYAPYFLTVQDIVAFAESRGILCQGRGSAANSVVCYALRVTAVSPDIAAMVFERFVSEARDEPPDIDVDFEHERREEVIQHIYRKYGRHRAGLCATVIHYRARRAIREVGRAMGLSVDVCGALASQVWGWSDVEAAEARLAEIGLDPSDRRLRQTLELAQDLIGFPRHLSQHVGGFIITRGRLDELVPIENAAMEDRTVIEWDKDDIDALGILKVDLLSLGMLTCIRKAFDLIEAHGGPRHDLATLPPEDPAVYDMLCRADSVGVFQVESRAQMNFLPRMRPRKFYDLVIQVAIVRPGPIQGNMVHPYIRRRRGEEAVSFPSDALGEVLGKTLGVPLFQEQAMQIAIIGAGFTPTEADRLRRALATFRKSGTIHNFRDRFVQGMLNNGYDLDFAERCFSQIEGFGEYGFPESHAASFALLVYASSWLKCHHPAGFACALLNSQPMGFYAPAQIVRDARGHGVDVRPPCVNASFWDNTLERAERSTGGLALRLGFRQIKGVKEEEARWIAAARANGWHAPEDLVRRAGIGADTLTRLAEADAFAGLGLSRRQALWAAKAVAPGQTPPLFAGLLEGEGIEEPPVHLPPMTTGEEVVEDYVAMRLTLRAHPVALLRPRLTPAIPEGGAGHGRLAPPRPAAADAANVAPGANEPPSCAASTTAGPTARHMQPAPWPGEQGGLVPSQNPAPPVRGDWPRPPGCTPSDRLFTPPQNARVAVAGLVIVRQRPGSAKGVIFVTLEDETGVVNVIIWQKVYEIFRRQIISGRLLRVIGRVQREGQVVHVIAEVVEDLSVMLDDLARGARQMPDPAGPTDEARRPVDTPHRPAAPSGMHPRSQAKRLFPSRDFH
jgi:DNA-directed DNA polymerase III PolC